jgi:arylsulfatase A-like enzyme
MKRRDFIKALGSGAAALAARSAAAPETNVKQRPNVLLLHTDQHRIDCLGAYGNRDIRTPHLDALAADGVRFVNSFCPFPVCTPSRYSLLSGRYVHEHRGWTNQSTLAPEIDTFPRILRAAGYQTKAVGKMHFTPTYLDVGFDEIMLSEQDGEGRWDDDYHRHLMRLGLVDRNDLEDQRREYRNRASQTYWDTFGAMVSNLPEAHHTTTWIAEQALATLDSWQPDRSHLLTVGFVKPHHPFDPPAPWHEMYDPNKLSLLPGWIPQCLDYDLKFHRGYFPNEQLTESSLRRVMAYYYATISQIDHHIGRMVALLKKKGLCDNTLIVFTADHGEYMGHHHLLLKGNHMYDPLVKVPLLIKWPAGRHAGTVSQRMVSNIDIAPTLCCAAGCKPGAAMHGQDLRDDGPGHEWIFAEAGPRHVMVRSRTRKLILAGQGRGNLFFDLENDPLELQNLHARVEHRSEVERMERALAQWRPTDTKPNVHLDRNAPQIRQPNVPPRDLSHRPKIIEYYQKKMEGLPRVDATKTPRRLRGSRHF